MNDSQVVEAAILRERLCYKFAMIFGATSIKRKLLFLSCLISEKLLILFLMSYYYWNSRKLVSQIMFLMGRSHTGRLN